MRTKEKFDKSSLGKRLRTGIKGLQEEQNLIAYQSALVSYLNNMPTACKDNN